MRVFQGHVECMSREEGGCSSEGEEGESCPPLAGMSSQLVGKDVLVASIQVWHRSLL